MIIEVDFNGTANSPKPKLLLKKQDPDAVFCNHNQLEINHHKRTLSCDKCGKVLDAYDYIYELAVKESRLFSDIKQLQKDVQELAMQREALKAQVGRLKSNAKKLLKNQVVIKTNIASIEDGKSCLSQIKQGLKSCP